MPAPAPSRTLKVNPRGERSMARKPTPPTLTHLLDQTSRPVYVVDGERRVVYCNSALAAWLDIPPERIVGRLVEYHSETAGAAKRDAAAPLADLCPPPRALAGEACRATISCVARDGRLVHRHAEFLPLDSRANQRSDGKNTAGGQPAAVFVVLAAGDLSPEELAADLAAEPEADALHRTIRQFRRGQAACYRVESILGNSPAMQKVRAQVAAAAASAANVWIAGPRGSGRGHIARAIHYHAAGDTPAKLVPLDCQVLSDHLLRRAIETLGGSGHDARQQATLLLENLEALSAAHQSQLLSLIRRSDWAARTTSTCASPEPNADGTPTRQPGKPAAGCPVPATIDPVLVDALSTITICVPRLVDRLEDLPILAQCFLEACNRGSGHQVGSLRADALDLLALHSWPGELDELRNVVAAAHAACKTHEVTPADLPAVVHHARQAAAYPRRVSERIVLDELLAEMEKEVIGRALAQARGNKSEAAELLGMTRPRLYRRLVQLGLIVETTSETEPEAPEFIEREATDQPP